MPWRTKRGGEHHIATDHGPMVQGKLLTSHPGSIHGGEETPGGRPSLRQGAGKRSAGAPDLRSAAAAEQRRDREKGFCPRGFRVTENIEAKGGSQRWTRGPRRPPGAAPGGGAPGVRPGPPWLPSGPTRALREASFTLIFYLIFPEFMSTFYMGEN